MSFREADSARTENLSLYTSLTASRGKDFELGEDDLPESNASETDIPALSSSFVTFQLPPLHEAAERGDPQAVARLLLDKSVDVNKKAGGHRAMRTALHRAAGYGHLAVVKLLLKAGADPMKFSSVHRTPLHEACTGGHTQVVEKLLQHMTDIDIADSNGQTAAHLAAYHGESQCLKVLLSSGSNVTLEDKLGRSPAHLAAMKNHPSVLRCLIESDGELSHVDDQGRTPAHHAATAGGLEAIKALAHNDIDVNSRDTAGCVPAHYAAANNHCSCLGFLLGSGLAKRDVRDRTGRSLLHMAAQHGATECVHWLLECGASPNIRDGSGATPLHSAASGAHLQSVSCLIKHGGDTDAQTATGDLPLDFAKRTGNPNSFLKAVNGEVPCKFCISKQRKIDYDLAHQPTPVERKIIQQESEIFETSHSSNVRISEGQRVRPSHSSRRPGTNSSNITTNLPKRDLATKYFGDHLFSLPVTFTGSESVTSTNRTRRKR
ncbi:unnamed protein product [Porites lobata]|uniref:Uncharacterized protein n=1 Tax=Porites lobata TaxID=104759 RepID=A0ABN8RDU3_9CNID|nr:unnamed protein product [Porites lobata]